MGILFVLLIWGTLGLLLAGAGTLLIVFFVTWLTRNASSEVERSARKKIIRNAGLFPVGCLIWTALIFVFQGLVNDVYLHRDVGLGDSWYCPLPNGYAILMIDVDDSGTVYNPKTQGENGSVGDRIDAVSGVTQVQIAGPNVLGARDSHWFGKVDQAARADRYFVLDTRVGQHTDFENEEALRAKAAELGVTLNLEPISKVYSRYRFTWFDVLAAFLLIGPIFFAGGYLLFSALRLRSSAMPSQLAG
jgi:hypothetical protein